MMCVKRSQKNLLQLLSPFTSLSQLLRVPPRVALLLSLSMTVPLAVVALLRVNSSKPVSNSHAIALSPDTQGIVTSRVIGVVYEVTSQPTAVSL